MCLDLREEVRDYIIRLLARILRGCRNLARDFCDFATLLVVQMKLGPKMSRHIWFDECTPYYAIGFVGYITWNLFSGGRSGAY